MKPQELKILRRRLSLSQAELGHEIGVSGNTVARWERGETSIPVAIAKLTQFMVQAESRTSATLSLGAIGRDPHHIAILEALNRNIDPDVFEACAAELLANDWPGLVPVRGGSDAGFDGAVASKDQAPFPLVATTSNRAKDNLRRNLKQAVKKGWNPDAAIFATPRRITPKARITLTETANEFGVQLLQIYDQDWFANVLYRQPGWCKRLLGLTGQPSALSVIPLSNRPLLGDRVLGREKELEILRNLTTDCVVVGGPGSGKTFVLRAIALEGHALFLTDNDHGAIANAVREQTPKAIIVDDAHVNAEILTTLNQTRKEIRADFKIIAVSWPADLDRVRSKLDTINSDVLELPLIDADTMVEIVKSTGLDGPNPLIGIIVQQARGLPGLAATLAHLCLRGEVNDVLSGETLARQLSPALDDLIEEDSSRLLAAFSLGGANGCRQEIISTHFQRPLDEISSALSRLSTAGVIRQSFDGSISVWPETFRWVLVKRVFFGGPVSLNYKSLFNKLPDADEKLRTLIGARSRGASIPQLEALLEARRSSKLWSEYACLGPSEFDLAFQRHPEFAMEMVNAGLEFNPEKIIPFLLDRATGDDRALHNSPDHPLRKIEGWITYPAYYGHSTMERRQALVSAVEHWWNSDRANDLPATHSAVRALTIAFRSNWLRSETDPGQGRSVTFHTGVLGAGETEEIKKLWVSTSKILLKAVTRGFWTHVLDLIRDWHYNPPRINLSEDIRAGRTEMEKQMIKDVALAARKHPGVQHCLAKLGGKTGLVPLCHLDPDFEIIYPIEHLKKFDEQNKKWIKAVNALAMRWKSLDPKAFATKISLMEEEARLVNITFPRLSEALCSELAVNVAYPLKWAEALLDSGAPADLQAPFVHKALEQENDDPFEFLRQCLESEQNRWFGFNTIITLSNSPRELLDEALRYASSFPQLIETACLRGEVPPNTLLLLLTATDERVALAAALGEWSRAKHTDQKLHFPNEWRKTILRSPLFDDLANHDEYWIGDILESDQSLAREWLMRLIKVEDRYIGYGCMEISKKAIATLDHSNRIEFMTNLPQDHELCELLGRLVGDDLDVYRNLLNINHLSLRHLYPLQNLEATNWGEMAVLALDAGYSVDEVVKGTHRHSWEWSGAESVMWIERKQAFEKFLSHPDLRVTKVATRCIDDLEKQIEKCLERERSEEIYGH